MEDPLISVGALHALTYCERLFYLEEIEHLRLADAAVFAGRALHTELLAETADGTWERPILESERLGLRGAPDLPRRRDGAVIPYEHKRGRSAGSKGAREAWRTDRIQVAAYAMLVEEASGQKIEEGRVRYHADEVTVRVPVDSPLIYYSRKSSRHTENLASIPTAYSLQPTVSVRAEPALWQDVLRSVARARELRESLQRPPVPANERLCVRCALAPVCLPEEARLAHDADFRPIRLLPAHSDGKIIHVLESGATVGRSEERLVCRSREGGETAFPVAEVASLVLHGLSQVTTRALRLCAEHEIPVFWMTFGGSVVGAFSPAASSGQRHLRQFEALRQTEVALGLARRLASAKAESQLRFLLRATRETGRSDSVTSAAQTIRHAVRRTHQVSAAEELLGLEGSAAAACFSALPELLSDQVDQRLRFRGRSRRPPKDRFNALF